MKKEEGTGDLLQLSDKAGSTPASPCKKRRYMKVKYVETSPLQREIIFDGYPELSEFYYKYHDELWEKYCKDIKDFRTALDIMEKVWQKEYFKITKKGERRKYHYPAQLMTPEAKEKQKINWEAYVDRRNQQRTEIKEQLKQKEEEIRKTLVEQGYDIKKIEIKAREK